MAMIDDRFSAAPFAFSVLTAATCAKLSAQLMGIPASDSGVVAAIIIGIGIITSIAIGVVFRRSEHMEMWIVAGWILIALIALIALLVSSLVWLVVRFV